MKRYFRYNISLEAVFFLMKNAEHTLLAYGQDRTQVASDAEFALLKAIYERAQRLQMAALHVEICLHHRMKGGPEPAPPAWEEPEGR